MTVLLAVGGYLAAVSIAVWLIGVMTGGDSPSEHGRDPRYTPPGIDEPTGKA